jgi:hypothetical protein
MNGPATTCKKCNRAMWANHLSADGLCPDCEPKKKDEPKATDKDK